MGVGRGGRGEVGGGGEEGKMPEMTAYMGTSPKGSQVLSTWAAVGIVMNLALS